MLCLRLAIFNPAVHEGAHHFIRGCGVGGCMAVDVEGDVAGECLSPHSCADGGGGPCHTQKTYKLGVGSQNPGTNKKKKNFIANAFKKGADKLETLGEKPKIEIIMPTNIAIPKD